MEFVLPIIIGVVLIALVTAIAPKVGVAGPLLLTALGVIISFLPFTPEFQVDPEWILVGILPPLLYGAAVSLPSLEFRRDFSMISGLSVVLVLVSATTLGIVFSLIIPGLGLAGGIALGAILSPTDAVATSIVKRLGISPRTVTVLEGESLINDATALVVLRTAIAASGFAVASAHGGPGDGFNLGQAVGSFLWAVVVAVAIGAVIGAANLFIRSWIPSTPAATALSFVVPYVAYLPTEHLGGSGLVAAVVAGIVTGQGAAKHFSAEQRLSDRVNWRTIELMLEGAVFLVMGLEVSWIVQEAETDRETIFHAALLATLGVSIILAVRMVYVALLIWLQALQSQRRSAQRVRLEHMSARVEKAGPERVPERFMERVRTRTRRRMSDLDYYDSSPLTWREGSVLLWAGMRGAVTLAAAQTLPHETPHRALLILIAFLVATGSLAIQGGTLSTLVRLLGLTPAKDDAPGTSEIASLNSELRETTAELLRSGTLMREDGRPFSADLLEEARMRMSEPIVVAADKHREEYADLRMSILLAQRRALVRLRSEGRYSTSALRSALELLDAEELSLRARLDHEE